MYQSAAADAIWLATECGLEIWQRGTVKQATVEPVQAAAAACLERDGYALVDRAGMTLLTTRAGAADWESFARSWDHLGPDRFMAGRWHLSSAPFRLSRAHAG